MTGEFSRLPGSQVVTHPDVLPDVSPPGGVKDRIKNHRSAEKMNTSSRPNPAQSFLLALGCALGLVFAAVPAVQAAEADAKALPLTAVFEKVAKVEEAPPFALHLKNTSKESLKVNLKVRLAVVAHPMAKARDINDHVIDAGQTWTVSELAAGDKVTVTAAGYAPLELVVSMP